VWRAVASVGEDVSEVLEYVPARFKVIGQVRPKLSCASCERIVQAPAPSRPIATGLAATGFRLVDAPTTQGGLPVLHRSSSCMHAGAITPVESQSASFALFLCNISLPRNYGGSASTSRLSRPAQRSLALRPAYSPSHFHDPLRRSRFVTSTTAPIATGWNESCRAGFAHAGKPCLCTAYMIRTLSPTSRALGSSARMSGVGTEFHRPLGLLM
jgi:hypothetical protein